MDTFKSRDSESNAQADFRVGGVRPAQEKERDADKTVKVVNPSLPAFARPQ
jgi:hypothetical protein